MHDDTNSNFYDLEKPSSIPWNSFSFILLNVLLFFIYDYYQFSVTELLFSIIPTLFFNVLFFRIEHQEYKRKKSKYLALCAEMDKLYGRNKADSSQNEQESQHIVEMKKYLRLMKKQGQNHHKKSHSRHVRTHAYGYNQGLHLSDLSTATSY